VAENCWQWSCRRGRWNGGLRIGRWCIRKTQGGFDAGARLPRQLAVEQFPPVDRRLLPLRPPTLSLSDKCPSIPVTTTLGCGPCGSPGCCMITGSWPERARIRALGCCRQAGGARRPPRSPGPAPGRVRQHHLSDHALTAVTGPPRRGGIGGVGADLTAKSRHGRWSALRSRICGCDDPGHG
jgi:hypothetical protein